MLPTGAMKKKIQEALTGIASSGGLSAPKEMLAILGQPGYISREKGSQRARRLYSDHLNRKRGLILSL
jgi:hypothetical protein